MSDNRNCESRNRCLCSAESPLLRNRKARVKFPVSMSTYSGINARTSIRSNTSAGMRVLSAWPWLSSLRARIPYCKFRKMGDGDEWTWASSAVTAGIIIRTISISLLGALVLFTLGMNGAQRLESDHDRLCWLSSNGVKRATAYRA